jgi:hypothetical protein
MEPHRTLTVPLGMAGVLTLWLASAVLLVAGAIRTEDGAMGGLGLLAFSTLLMNFGILWAVQHMLGVHRRRMRRILCENREAILEGVALQLMARDEIRRDATTGTVRRLPTARL